MSYVKDVTRKKLIHFLVPVGSANVEGVPSENGQHEIEQHVMAQSGELLVDALQMDAEQSPVQVEGR